MILRNITITTSSFAQYNSRPLDLCRQKQLDPRLSPYKRKVTSCELIELAKEAVGIIAGTESFSRETLLKLKSLKVISRCGTGMDSIDLTAAKELGITVVNTPDGPTLAVAELTVGLILNLLRKISRSDAMLKAGNWQKFMGNLLSGKKVGIVGFGRIGQKVAQLLKPFGCEIAYADPFVENGSFDSAKLPLDELLGWADIVSLHVSSKEQLLGPKEFKLLKSGAWLINTSRGAAVDEGLLFEYLQKGRLSGAALDVFKDEPYKGPLNKLDNIILTSHIGSYAREARIKMEIESVENLLKALNIK